MTLGPTDERWAANARSDRLAELLAGELAEPGELPLLPLVRLDHEHQPDDEAAQPDGEPEQAAQDPSQDWDHRQHAAEDGQRHPKCDPRDAEDDRLHRMKPHELVF